MLNSIVDKYYDKKLSPWEKLNPRFKKLKILDLWLDGKFYDAIPNSFWDEESGKNGDYISITDRQPAVQANIPHMVANICARKLFGGRHVPRLKHDDETAKKKIQALVDAMHIPARMLEAVKFGSVGSILVLFKFLPVNGIVKGALEVVRSYNVTPDIDEFGELRSVCIHYLTQGWRIKDTFSSDMQGNDIKADRKYWYVRRIDDKSDCIYLPVIEEKWNPVEKSCADLKEAVITPHTLGFVPGIWIKNLPGGMNPDGECTFETALNNFIEYDYMGAQTGRGLFYSAAPQLVLKGDILNHEETDTGFRIKSGPVNCIQLAPDQKDAFGGTVTGHDAKLLDTSAEGLKCSIEFGEKLRHTSLEQISASRKDLDSIKGTMSGKAMELIDQEFLDLIQELRVQYCEYGYLPLIKKICNAAVITGHPLAKGLSPETIDALEIQYPAMYTPNMQEFLFLAQALDLLVNGSQTQGSQPKGPDGKPMPMPPPKPGLLSPEDARIFLAAQMDLSIESSNLPMTQFEPSDKNSDPPADTQTQGDKTDQNDLMKTLMTTPYQGHVNPGNIPM